MATTRRKGARKVSKNIPQGIAYIKASFNNTIVSVADRRGNVISWCSAGKLKYTGPRKSTAFVAARIVQEAAAVAMQNGMREVEVRVSGPGAGREAAVRAFETAGMTVTSISDTTPVPHNGCRPRKRRRV
ncbi:30S ribosomal protein S11 [bacterium]|jgi:small subunit ribosomal protein S11|nr:30S ribosomal protein S11 [bacterium]